MSSSVCRSRMVQLSVLIQLGDNEMIKNKYSRTLFTSSALLLSGHALAQGTVPMASDQTITKVEATELPRDEVSSRDNHFQLGLGSSNLELNSVDLKGRRSLFSYNRGLSKNFRLGMYASKTTAEFSKNNTALDIKLMEIGPEARLLGAVGKMEFFGLLRLPLIGSGEIMFRNGEDEVKGDMKVSGAEIAAGAQLNFSSSFALGLEVNLAVYKKIDGDLKSSSTSSYNSDIYSYKVDDELSSTSIGSNMMLTATVQL